ncbi:MAG: prolipoprotein diacylglyceryl transferase [Myxococcales bacterium]|nr:prolipoprotein diacylglyceryl transferase [Myxococcales bacterium]
MHPILFDIGGLSIHTYGAMGALAFLVGCSIVLWRCQRLGLDLNPVADVIFWMAVTGLLGSRVLFVLQHPELYDSLWQVLDLRDGGLVFYGSFVVGIPVGFGLMRRAGLPAFAVWDTFGTAFPLSHAISRVGCYAAGCCWGLPTDQAWGVTFPEGTQLAPAGIALHPVQLYEATALLAIAVVTNLFYRYRRFDGQVFLLYLLLYAGVRSVTEVFRGDVSRGFFLPEVLGETLSYSQGMSGVLALVALTVFLGGARWQAEATRESG